MIDVKEALERSGWTVTNMSNGGPVGHVEVADGPLVECFTREWGYYLEAGLSAADDPRLAA